MKYLLSLLLVFSACAVNAQDYPDLTTEPKELREWVNKNPKAYKSELKDLQKEAKKYQHLFKLDDWKVTVDLVSQEEAYYHMKDPVWAFSFTHQKEFHIFILTRHDYSLYKREFAEKEHISIKTDQHASVVHEYMHLIWKLAKEEWACERISKLIIVKNYHD